MAKSKSKAKPKAKPKAPKAPKVKKLVSQSFADLPEFIKINIKSLAKKEQEKFKSKFKNK